MDKYNERVEKAISDLNMVEFSNLQFKQSDGIRGYTSLLDELCIGHLIAKISMDFSKVESSPCFGDDIYIHSLLHCQKFQEELFPGPDFEPFYEDDAHDFKKPFHGVSSLYPLLGGLYAWIDLDNYGPKNKPPPDELIASTKKFIDEFLPCGFRGYNLYTTYEAWACFFGDINVTYIVLERNMNKTELNFICLTTSD